jgi:hypothetical protein
MVVQALSKKGGTVKLQKLLAMISKKLAKQETEALDRDSILSKVCFLDAVE